MAGKVAPDVWRGHQDTSPSEQRPQGSHIKQGDMPSNVAWHATRPPTRQSDGFRRRIQPHLNPFALVFPPVRVDEFSPPVVHTFQPLSFVLIAALQR